MRLAWLLGFAVQAGCLVAPSRPAGGATDGGVDDADGSGGGVTACAPAGTVYGVSLVVAIDGVDRVLRVGHVDGNGWFVYLFAPDTLPGACAQSRAKLAGNRVTSVEAVVPAFDGTTLTDLLALASLDTGAAVIDLAAGGGTFNDVGRVTVSNFRPQPVTTPAGSDPAAFIAWDRGRELWFGGGTAGIAVVSAAARPTGAASVITAGGGEAWYGAIALRSPHGAKRFALVGATAAYEAAHNGASINTSADTPHVCTAPCARLAFTVPGQTAGTIEAFSVDRATGAVETIESRTNGIVVATRTPSPPGTGAVLDVAIGDIVGDAAIDAAVLWGSRAHDAAAQLIVYDGLLARDTSSALGPVALDSRTERVVIARTATGPRILALSSQAGIDRCLRVASDGRTLEDCR